MFKNLLSFWKGRHFLDQVFTEFKEMLDDTEQMFTMVTKRLIDNVQQPDLKQRIYSIDSRVNALQREIRRRIVEHLTLQPTVNVTACLVLMSVVKDAERLGDYCKNLGEVIALLEKPIERNDYAEYFDELDKRILSLFAQTRDAFVEADEDKAKATWNTEREIAKTCDSIVKQLSESDLDTNQAVCYSLIARHYKRIVAHLVNIATSVILPLSDLDYFDEKRVIE